MNVKTFYSCDECGVSVAYTYSKKRILSSGDPGFPEDGKSWEKFLNCPVCKKPQHYEENEVLCDS